MVETKRAETKLHERHALFRSTDAWMHVSGSADVRIEGVFMNWECGRGDGQERKDGAMLEFVMELLMLPGASSPRRTKSSSRRFSFLKLMLLCSVTGGTLAAVVLIAGCEGGSAMRQYTVTAGGSAERGKVVIAHYKCGKCHTIPGIRNAHGVFGPPLEEVGVRTFIGGDFANTPENLIHWVQSPQSMKPKTAMPDLGLTDQQARDAAAYLENLR